MNFFAYFSLSQVMNFINRFLPKKTKHDVLFYSTLLAKLMESAYKVVDINMNIEQLTYNVTLRNPKAVEILKGVPPHIIGKAFEALADSERTLVRLIKKKLYQLLKSILFICKVCQMSVTNPFLLNVGLILNLNYFTGSDIKNQFRGENVL